MPNDRLELDHANVVVTDMNAAVAFYRALGLEVSESGGEFDAHHRNVTTAEGSQFDLDSAAFAQAWDSGWQGGPGTVMTFRTEDREAVDRVYERLTTAGYASQQPPYDAFWGARFAVISDPSGNAVGIMSPSDAEHRRPPVGPAG